MTLNIFNPKFCLTDHLSASWCSGVGLSKSKKIPIEVVQGVPRLKFSLSDDSETQWFCGVVALNSAWAAVDLTEYKFLNLTFYADDNICCRIGFKDEDENDSNEIDLHREPDCVDGQECHLSLPLSSFKEEGYSPQKGRLLKIVGYNDACFYISAVTLSSEASI